MASIFSIVGSWRLVPLECSHWLVRFFTVDKGIQIIWVFRNPMVATNLLRSHRVDTHGSKMSWSDLLLSIEFSENGSLRQSLHAWLMNAFVCFDLKSGPYDTPITMLKISVPKHQFSHDKLFVMIECVKRFPYNILYTFYVKIRGFIISKILNTETHVNSYDANTKCVNVLEYFVVSRLPISLRSRSC